MFQILSSITHSQYCFRSLSAYLQILRNLFKDFAERLATFERKVLRRMFGGIKVKENWGKPYSKEVMQLCGD